MSLEWQVITMCGAELALRVIVSFRTKPGASPETPGGQVRRFQEAIRTEPEI